MEEQFKRSLENFEVSECPGAPVTNLHYNPLENIYFEESISASWVNDCFWLFFFLYLNENYEFQSAKDQ